MLGILKNKRGCCPRLFFFTLFDFLNIMVLESERRVVISEEESLTETDFL